MISSGSPKNSGSTKGLLTEDDVSAFLSGEEESKRKM